MDRPPSFDVSAPSPLRLAGFLITVTGGLLAGVGAALTWVTVGIGVAEGVSTPTKGLDIRDGQVVLACAVVMLIAVLVTRLATSSGARRAAAVLVIVAGIVTLAVAGSFVMTASSRFEPLEDDELVSAISTSTGIPADEVRAALEESIEELEPFTRVGPGPYVSIAGGMAGLVGGIVVLAWVGRLEEPNEPAGDDAPTGSEGTDEA